MRERRGGSQAEGTRKPRSARSAPEVEFDPELQDGEDVVADVPEEAPAPRPPSRKANQAWLGRWVIGLAAAFVVLVVVIQMVRSGSAEKKALEDDQLCTNDITGARERIAASKWDEARDYVSAAQVACGAKRANEFVALREEFNAAKTAEDGALAQQNAALVKQHRDDATRVWNAYDNLPAAKKSKLDLMAAISEARSHERELPAELAARVRLFNETQARLRMAPLINPESRAEGDRAEILVPSADRAKCVIWGSQWSQEVDSLQAIGFEKIRCAESSYKSHLTAEQVVEPARVWNVPKP